jgi:hypothetical protein
VPGSGISPFISDPFSYGLDISSPPKTLLEKGSVQKFSR